MSKLDERALNNTPSEQQKARRERRRKQIEQKEANTAANREYRRRRNRRFLLAIAVAAILIALFAVALSAMKIFELQESKASAEKELTALENREEGLKEELKQVESDEYIIEQARSVLRMIFSGEILYVFRGSKDDPAVQLAPDDDVKPQ